MLAPTRDHIARTPGRLTQFSESSDVKLANEKSSIEDWKASPALQGRLRRDGAIVELSADMSSAAGCSPDSNDVGAGR
jgi:hypothetical protein